MYLGGRAGPKPEELVELCRRHALPLTVQRRAILEALSVRSDHPTADQIFDHIKSRIPEVSRTTVYRILETFVRIGVARRVCHPGAAARYEVQGQRHHHLVCLRCEKMVDFADPSLDALRLPKAGSGFHIEDYSIQFRGLCADCAGAPHTRRERPRRPGAPARKPKPKMRKPGG